VVDKRATANFIKTTIQSALLYAAKTWHTPNEALMPLIVFHNYIIPHISRRHIKKYQSQIFGFIPIWPQSISRIKNASNPGLQTKMEKNQYHGVKDRQIFVAAQMQEYLMVSNVHATTIPLRTLTSHCWPYCCFVSLE
jgi:hypothetical protein